MLPRIRFVSLFSLCMLAVPLSSPLLHALASEGPAPPMPIASDSSPDVGMERLEKELARLAAKIGGEVGVTAIHLETGRRASLNGADRFPMASTFKLPLAVYVLARVDRGEEQLDRLVPVRRSDLRPFSNTSATSDGPGAGVSIRKLLEVTLIDSDNTAADLLLKTIGGPSALTAWLKTQGLEGIEVSRSEGQIALEMNGVTKFPPEAEWTLEMFDALKKSVPAGERTRAMRQFEAGPQDTTSPDAMAALLVQVAEGRLLKPETNAWLLSAMRRCKTGDRRLRAQLPPGTVVADKTGTVARSVNDVGIITLPGGGRVAVTVYIKLSDAEFSTREQTIAAVGRAVFDAFLPGQLEPAAVK